MLRKLGLGMGAFLLAAIVIAGIAVLVTAPERLPETTDSSTWLVSGPFNVVSVDRTFIDNTRPTDENNGVASSASRTLNATVWYPQDNEAAVPLIVHSHGFVSSRSDLSYAAEHLASYGYIVAAADFPLTHGGAPGGPNALDVVNQPADVSFLIDSLIDMSNDEETFTTSIDESRIAVMGYSLGGLTTSLVTYHSELRDPRIKAAVSIAGLAAPLQPTFYRATDVPFLMIAGTLDALINFEAHAATIPERVPNSAVVRIEGGTHLGFAALAEPLLRFMHHPDGLGCSAVISNMGDGPDEAFNLLGSSADGIELTNDIPDICESMPTAEALHPGRQQMATKIALLTFFESVFAEDPGRRSDAAEALSTSLAVDMEEISFEDS